MKRFTFLLLLLSFYCPAQNQDCTPRRSSTVVCDSVYALCRKTASAMAQQSVSDPQSTWYDSLYFPEKLMDEYTEALAAWYNDLPDSLADFRSYLHSYKLENPDSNYTARVSIPYRTLDTLSDRTTGCGNERVDSLMKALGFTFSNVLTLHSLDRYAEWTISGKLINRAYVARKLRKINPGISLGNVYLHGNSNLMQVKHEKNSIAITVTEFLNGPDDDGPIPFIRRTFTYRHGFAVIQTGFSRGSLPRIALIPEDE